jgi:hypothetical protein
MSLLSGRVILRSVASGLLLLSLGAAALVSSRKPSLERMWDEDVRVLTSVDVLPDGTRRLGEVRHWTYSRDAVLSKGYSPVAYDPADVQGLWMYEQVLGLGGRIAHTFLVFEFPESYGEMRWLGLSVETRREVGETYSLVRGVLRGFEVTHIWAVEEDLVRRRVEYLDYPLTRYRVTVPVEYIQRVFEKMVDETAALAETPRWYNTVATNCTSSLIRYVNEAEPGAIPRHYSSVLTGRADDHLGGLGYLDLGSAEHITREWLRGRPLRAVGA